MKISARSFSLKALLLFVTATCVLLAWKTHAVLKQQRAIIAIEALGGRVTFDYQYSSRGVLRPDAKPTAPEWLRSLVGEDYFRMARMVDLGRHESPFQSADRIVDRDLAVLALIPSIDAVTLYGQREITDAGLVHLAGHRRLRRLIIDGTSIAGSGLRDLACLPTLEYLRAENSLLDDAGMAALTKARSLASLNVSATKVTDKGLAHTEGLSSLVVLFLDDLKGVTDAGLPHLFELQGLARLGLGNTNTTPEGRDRLSRQLPSLKSIEMNPLIH